jgi:hypothetical protein
MAFNLSALVREALHTSRKPDPADVAAEVFEVIPAEHQIEALRQALRVYVQNIASRTRYQIVPALSESTDLYPGDHRQDETHGSGVPGVGPSWRVAAHREEWRQMLEKRMSLTTNGREWRVLGDCREGDLKFIAETKRAMAERNLARAQDFLILRSLLRQHKVDTVRELPTTVLAKHLSAMADRH